jgi:hypothetical protein
MAVYSRTKLAAKLAGRWRFAIIAASQIVHQKTSAALMDDAHDAAMLIAITERSDRRRQE